MTFVGMIVYRMNAMYFALLVCVYTDLRTY